MHAVQATFADLGTPLSGVTFVVVDLETTGGSASACEITEVGAVKVRGGEVLGEFQTLVNPGAPIPPFISVLTGISDVMVASAPRIDAVLPAFLEFARDSVLVAHNAGFDVSFLRAAATRTGHLWPGFRVVDTVHLARHLVSSDEAHNRKLSTLAGLFAATTTPNHRALSDARATVDVLHALIGRVGNQGVHTLEELLSYSTRVSPAQRRKRFLADGLPPQPGVYVFKDARGRPLYVGTSTNIHRRVRSYFTASEQRSRMAQMVTLAHSVQPIVCQTGLEAQVRELRLIAEHRPRFNRRSTRPDRAWWVTLTAERFPRLTIVRSLRAGGHYLGPYADKASAEDAVAALQEVLALRQCTIRLTRRPQEYGCILAEMGRCGSPCTGEQSEADYAVLADSVLDLIRGASRHPVQALAEKMALLASQERYEEAAVLRDRGAVLVRGLRRAQRLGPFSALPEVVAARPLPVGGWELVCIRYGRLAGASTSPRGADPMPYVAALCQTAEVVDPPVGPRPAATVEEAELLLRWLEEPGTRLVRLDGEWASPVAAAAAVADTLGGRSHPTRAQAS